MATQYTKHNQGANIFIGLDDASVTTTSSGSNYTSVSVDVYLKHYTISYGNTWWVEGTLSNGTTSWTAKLNGISIKKTSSALYETKIGAISWTGTIPPGNYSITLSFSDNYYEYKYGSADYTVHGHLSHTWSGLSLATLITANTAPTECSFPSYGVPGRSYSVTLSGAQAGTANSISGYEIYAKVGSAPTTSSYEYHATSSTSTVSFTLSSSASRGYNVYVIARALSPTSGYESGWMSAKNGGVINVLPGAVSLNPSTTQTVTSGTSTVSITPTAGAANAGATGRAVYYNNSNSHTDQKEVTSGTAFTIGGSGQKAMPTAGHSQTYYFWTYDGAEYGPVSSITITRNAAPTLSNVSFAGDTAYTANNVSTYYSKLKINYTANKTTQSIKINVYIRFSASSFTSSATTPAWPSSPTTSFNVTTTSATYNTLDILSLLASNYNTNGLYFQVKIKPSDSLENGSETTDTTIRQIAGNPSGIVTYDRFATTNKVNGSICNNQLRVAFNKDTSMSINKVEITGTASGQTNTITTTSYEKSTSGNTQYVDITLPARTTSRMGGGASISAKITLTGSGITKTVSTGSRTRIYALPTSMTWVSSDSTINMYDVSSSTNLTYSFSNSKITQTDTSTYYISTIAMQYSTSSIGSSPTTVSGVTFSTSGDNTVATVTRGNVAPFSAKSTYNGITDRYLGIYIQNAYGDELRTSTWLKITLNYDKAPTITNTWDLKFNWNGGSTWYTFNVSGNNINYLQEGMYIQASTSVTTYSQTAVTCTLYNGTTVLNTATLAAVKSDSANPRTASIIYGPIGLISNDTNRSLSIKVGSLTVGSAKSCEVVKHLDPPIVLTNAAADSITSNNSRTGANISYTFSITGLSNTLTTKSTGVTTNVRADLVDINNNVIAGTALINKAPDSDDMINITITGTRSDTSDDKTTWTQKTIKIKVVTTVTQSTNGTAKTHTSYSNIYVVYMDAPTVAYRSNYLGINTANPDETTVLDIYGTTGKNVIKIHGNTSYILVDFVNSYIDII